MRFKIFGPALDEMRQKRGELGPELNCEAHKLPTKFYCQIHKEFLCPECSIKHQDHADKLVAGDRRTITRLLN